MVHPAAGFNVFATANTKGKGSDDGRFIGTNVLNEAFLERFSITMEQEYPSAKVETKILKNVMKAAGKEDANFVELLVLWADIVRQTYKNDGITEIISTRRLVHICQAYSIFNGDRMKSIQMCVNRFDDDTKTAMIQLYEKVDESVNPPAPAPVVEEKKAEVVEDDIDSPF
jgi:MoxR-like ATPase